MCLQIKDIKDDVEYYIENCQEPDFCENDMMYDDIEGFEEMMLDLSNVSVEGHHCSIMQLTHFFFGVFRWAVTKRTRTQSKRRKRCRQILPVHRSPTCSTIIPTVIRMKVRKGGISHQAKTAK